MAELNDQAKELKRLLDTISPSLRRFGLDVYNSERKLRTLRNSPEFASMSRRNSLDASMASIKAMLDRYAKLAEADRLMRSQPGKFGTSAQAMEYQRRMNEINDPNYAARTARIARYGARGAAEIARAENQALFKRDTVSDAFEREKYALTQRYGGDADLAEKKLRLDALQKLPEFFRNSKMTARELRGVVKAIEKIPGYSRMRSSYDDLKGAGGLGTIAGKLNLLLTSIDVAKNGIAFYTNKEKEKRDVYTRARAYGWGTVQFNSLDQIMKHKYGSSAEGYLASSKAYAANMGRLKSGTGGTEFIDNLAYYLDTKDLIGSGEFGLPTAAEMRVRVAKRIRELGNPESKEYDHEKARALLEAYGGDDAFFNAAIDYGEDIENKLRHNRAMNKISRANMKGAEDAGNYLLGASFPKQVTEGAANEFIEGITDANENTKAIKATGHYNSGAFGMPVFGVLGSILSFFQNRDNVKKAEEAAKSADAYDKSKGGDGGAAGAKGGGKELNVSFNFSEVKVSADNPEEFILKTTELANERIQRNKSILAAFDMMEVA